MTLRRVWPSEIVPANFLFYEKAVKEGIKGFSAARETPSEGDQKADGAH